MAGTSGGGSGQVGQMLGQLTTEEAASRSFQTFLDLLPSGPEPALHSTDGRRPLSFAALRALAQRLDVAAFGIGRADRLCVVLPNGPESASAFLALSVQCVYAPLNIKLTEGELAFELEDLPARAVVVQAFSVERGEQRPVDSSLAIKVARRMDVPILSLGPSVDECGVFDLEWHEETPRRLEPQTRTQARRADLALVLHTSGTTKKPKIVPLTHENIAVGAQCIASTLQLKASEDLGVNIMPLFHIHGLSINVLASLLSGVPVLATPGFEVEGFFRWLEERRPTWYSAVPTMHQQILEVARERARENGQRCKYSLQLVRNCSAALLPHVAEGLEEAFGCVVMPTYAMTESMPIASNPRTADRGRRKLRAEARGEGGGSVGSVGLSGGPRVRLCTATGDVVGAYEEGEVCVSGECVTAGYELRPHMDADPNAEAFHRGEGGRRWLRTGDKGWVDAEGFLALTGRFKEIINRGGEKISPLEVEEALRTHAAVRDLVAFAAPHEELGETVAAAVVPSAADAFPEDPEEVIASLRGHGAAGGLNQKWLPDCVVFMESVPKGPTGKPARINLASRLHLPSLSGAMRTVWDVEGPPPSVDKAPFDRDAVRRRGPPRPPKPGPALQGARVVLNFLVWFNHIGYTSDRGLQQMRNNAGFTMSSFMFLLGLSLTSSVPDAGIPLSELRDFWVSRYGPPHSMFIFQVVVSFICWNMRCRTDAGPWKDKCRDIWYNVSEFVEAVTTASGQLHSWTGGILWFSTKMYWFILWFPIVDFVARRWLLGSRARSISLALSVFGAFAISPTMTYFNNVPVPYRTYVWTFAFLSGVFTWHVFRWSGRRSPRRRRMWGWITDLATLLLIGMFVWVYFDRCAPANGPYNVFNYHCSDEAPGGYNGFMHSYVKLQQKQYWAGRVMFTMSVLRLISPVLFLWFYGLCVGEGRVAWLLSRPLFSKFMGPLAFDVYSLQTPAFWIWWYSTRGLHTTDMFAAHMPFPIQAPLPMGESLCLWVQTYCFSWFYENHLSGYVVPVTLRGIGFVADVIFWPLTVAGICPRADGASAQLSTLAEVQLIAKRLTGVAHGPDSRLDDLNLDSFGTMALIGMIKASRPHAPGLSPGVLSKLQTLSCLAAYLESQESKAASQSKSAKMKAA